jgi:hypothetical protein
MENQELKCADLVESHLRSRIEDIRRMWEGKKEGNEDLDQEFNEFGLSFDYIVPHTYTDQKQGYFCWLLSWGGPQDQFEFYANPDLSVYKIVYRHLNWFDGAALELEGEDLELLEEIYNDMKECEAIKYVLEKAIAE